MGIYRRCCDGKAFEIRVTQVGVGRHDVIAYELESSATVKELQRFPDEREALEAMCKVLRELFGAVRDC